MGEVYKAADLLLGQPVALKFLPEALAAHEPMLERLRGEVRMARQVSHPNVCRVYDLGEAEGQMFLNMEFIDGEDLASLLRRIGHLPHPKALEIARKLCAGLAAAHEKGVIHRDFKPANIMIDGRGQVLITDFGLAAAAKEVKPTDIRSGTPAYMAPEQLRGEEVTPRSDIYALGLVLYEMFTGRHPFEGGKPEAGPPLMKDVDPAVERVVFRCLEADPRRRPGNALAIAAALPGGDPLAAALAAGETPSPEMVAAAGDTEAMNPKAALACFAALLAGILALAWVCGKGWVFAPAIDQKSPEVMTEKARDMLAQIGYSGKPLDSIGGYVVDATAAQTLAAVPSDKARRRIAAGRPLVVYFRYRSSPRRLVPGLQGDDRANETDPPMTVPGMVLVRLDPQGHLRYLDVVPPLRDESGETPAAYNWKPLFDAAGLDMTRYATVPAVLRPLEVFDQRGAWSEQGAGPPLRVEAAVWRNRPVWFTVTLGSTAAAPDVSAQARKDQRQGGYVIYWTILIGGTSMLAWRNQKARRGDTRGASRLATLAAFLSVAVPLTSQSHVLDLMEYSQLVLLLMRALFVLYLVGAAYLAFEPFVRRRWPGVLVSWTRALSGDLRDSLVGRDLLVGLLSGVWLVLSYMAAEFFSYGPAAQSEVLDFFSAAGAAHVGAMVARTLGVAVPYACWILFLLLATTVLLRRRGLAIGLVAVALTVLRVVIGSPHPLLTGAVALIGYGTALALTVHYYGFLGTWAALWVLFLAGSLPLTLDTSAWYFGASLTAMLAIAAVGYYGFRTAIAGQSIFGES